MFTSSLSCCESQLITIQPESIVFEKDGESRELTVLDDLVALEDQAFSTGCSAKR